jgi:hypothetical protein
MITEGNKQKGRAISGPAFQSLVLTSSSALSYLFDRFD